MTLLTESQYFSPVNFYITLFKYSNVEFELYENYRKMSFRNRCIIAGANGLINLSIPIENGREQKTIIKEIRISNGENWQARHWKSIASAYNRSPWFEHYRDGLENLYMKNYPFLFEWNLACFEWTMAQLQWERPVSFTNSYTGKYEQELFLDYRNEIIPSNYLSKSSPVYRQVFEDRYGFSSNLSILWIFYFAKEKDQGFCYRLVRSRLASDHFCNLQERNILPNPG